MLSQLSKLFIAKKGNNILPSVSQRMPCSHLLEHRSQGKPILDNCLCSVLGLDLGENYISLILVFNVVKTSVYSENGK